MEIRAWWLPTLSSRNAIKENLRSGIKACTENRMLLIQIFNYISSFHLFMSYSACTLFTILIPSLSKSLERQQTQSIKETEVLQVLLVKTKFTSTFTQKEIPTWPASTTKPRLLMQGLHLQPNHSLIYCLDILETKCLCLTSFPRISWQLWL